MVTTSKPSKQEEGAAYGAAILAGVGAKMWSSVDDACKQIVRIRERIKPQADAAKTMTASYAAFRRVYPATKTIFNS